MLCNSVVEQWNSDGGTGEQCCATVLWNSGTVMVEQCWWNSVVEHWNSVVEQWNSDGRTVLVEQCGGTVMVEQCGGTVWWNTGTVIVEQ